MTLREITNISTTEELEKLDDILKPTVLDTFHDIYGLTFAPDGMPRTKDISRYFINKRKYNEVYRPHCTEW